MKERVDIVQSVHQIIGYLSVHEGNSHLQTKKKAGCRTTVFKPTHISLSGKWHPQTILPYAPETLVKTGDSQREKNL